jgi:hypothetical protein
MGASVTLNIVLEEGRIATLRNRLRHWSVPARSNAGPAIPKEDNPALK